MTENARGLVAILIGSTALVVNDALVKLLSAELPSGELIVIRGVLATILLIAGVAVFRAARPIRILFTPMMLVRLFSAAIATLFIVISLRHLPLPIVNTVIQVTPLAATAGAAVIYREHVGWRRWLATLIGFLGVLLIAKPGGATFGAAAYIVLTALLFTTMRDLTTRGLDRDIPSIFVAAGSSAAIAVGGFLMIPFEAAWVAPSARAWLLMAMSAACLFVANTFVIAGLRTGEIAVIAPFRYAPVPLSLFLGYWWWGDLPDGTAFLGIGLVIAAGVYTLHRERHGFALARKPVPSPERSPAT